jgi:uncharacterized membrane protein YbhN (UPF0104 family)
MKLGARFLLTRLLFCLGVFIIFLVEFVRNKEKNEEFWYLAIMIILLVYTILIFKRVF